MRTVPASARDPDNQQLLSVLTALKKGDFSVRMPVDYTGIPGKIADALNDVIEQQAQLTKEVRRISSVVGKEGKTSQRASFDGVKGSWGDCIDAVNNLIVDLVQPTTEVARVIGAVANGDLSQTMALDIDGRRLTGEFLRTAKTINTMVGQLNGFASEVTRVAREVGTEGKLGGQADVQGVAGTWKDLTESVNFMAGNLTGQVRGIAKVVTAVAEGNLKQKLTVEAKGEIAALSDTINSMIETLATFADQVTNVAREVGVEGKLGGQAKVPGAAGIWKALTENVNQLAQNLTTQVRAIADVSIAVTKGDLTRSITVQTQGEVSSLKDTINEMIRNLRDSTTKNTEQDWLKTNLAKFNRMLQGQRDLTAVGRLILSELTPVVKAQQAEFYVVDQSDEPFLTLLASYGADGQASLGRRINLGQGLVGQCAIEKQKVLLNDVPEGYIRVASGLGNAPPRNVLVLPIIFEGQSRGVLELASLEEFTPMQHAFLDQLTESIGIMFNTIQANMRTEDLLTKSQSLAQELQQTNRELQEKAQLLAHQNQEVERKNQEVEQARQALEEKAKQLALTSKYKSEFLANMSHELRTPLNSLLILSDQLSKNSEGNLTGKQTEFAKTIHSSGNDLLMLINDILDLSKIESGTVVVDVGEVRVDDLSSFVERTFRHVAESKSLDFSVSVDSRVPEAMYTDAKRLQQVLKNLLSNAFKFTRHGQVTMSIDLAEGGWSYDNEDLNSAASVLAFTVSDTGIGISADKQQIIFEAFQQADGSTSRKYGGTGLGLAISRELSRLLGGEIRLTSSPGHGSTFTMFLPVTYSPARNPRRQGGVAEISVPAPVVPPRASPTSPSSKQVVPAVASLSPAELESNELDLISDDRDSIRARDRVMLIVENDVGFARFLLDTAREHGFKGIVTTLGAAAPSLARTYSPHLISLDIFLPDIDGWRILDRIKNSLLIRHIPICVISTDDSRERALQAGVAAFIAKPIRSKDSLDAMLDHFADYASRPERRVLLVEPAAEQRKRITAMIESDGVEVSALADGDSALAALDDGFFDSIITAPSVPDFEPEALARRLEGQERLRQSPVIVYSENGAHTESAWKCLSGIAAVRHTHSHERLIDEVAQALHRNVATLPELQRREIEELHDSTRLLAGKKVLIVDDDMRNIFALSAILEEHNVIIASAESGREAIDKLQEQEDIEVVLMDIMMPDMDGMETIREIRKIPRMRNLPIVAVTAKAMKGDREKCIEAGAWDYLAKPVDSEQLLAVLRGWLYR